MPSHFTRQASQAKVDTAVSKGRGKRKREREEEDFAGAGMDQGAGSSQPKAPRPAGKGRGNPTSGAAMAGDVSWPDGAQGRVGRLGRNVAVPARYRDGASNKDVDMAIGQSHGQSHGVMVGQARTTPTPTAGAWAATGAQGPHDGDHNNEEGCDNAPGPLAAPGGYSCDTDNRKDVRDLDQIQVILNL